jgi:branched-chain amino acid transport system permease protein
MLPLQLLINGVVTGCALGVIALSFSLVYSTVRIFHVAHAGVFALAGYVAWSASMHGVPDVAALLLAIAASVAVGALIQKVIYERLERRGGSHLVVLIASLGVLAVIQNVLAAIYTPNVLQFPQAWGNGVARVGGVILTVTQLAIVAMGLGAYAGVMLFTRRTALGRRIRAVASNPFLAEITRLRPRDTYVAVVAIASAIVALPGVLVPFDLGLQPYSGVTLLLTATIAMIAGGVGSITGAFVLSIAIAVLQNLALLAMPGEWSIGVTFFIFVVFMLFRPRGLFVAR